VNPAWIDWRLPFHICDQQPDELDIVDGPARHPAMATSRIPTAKATGFHRVGHRQDETPMVCCLLESCSLKHPRCVHPRTMQKQNQRSGGAVILQYGWYVQQIVSRNPVPLQMALEPLSAP
jgi:hypothetical protein